MAKRESGNGLIYAIHQLGTKAVKIGTANDPQSRMAGLQVGNPGELVLLATGTGGMWLEHEAHKYLKPARIRGEWYSLEHQVVWEVINALKARGTLTAWYVGKMAEGVKRYERRKTLREFDRLLTSLENIRGREKRAEVV